MVDELHEPIRTKIELWKYVLFVFNHFMIQNTGELMFEHLWNKGVNNIVKGRESPEYMSCWL